MKLLRLLIAAVVCLGLSGVIALAGTTGKIAGTVLDDETNEPLPGAVVTVLGTTMGANTDLNGRYMIINVPVGTFSVMAKMMGSETVTYTNVKSIMDLTTTVNFKLKPAPIVGKEVVIIAVRKMVLADATAKTTIMSSSDIMSLPGGSATSAIGQTAGVVTQANGVQNVRGGRSDEMAYFIDNVVVNDPLQGLVGAQINTGAIQEVMVITGGFNAEYGEAMSGVVNVVTKEGDKNLSVYGRYTTDFFLGDKGQGYNRIDGSVGGPVPMVPNLFYFFSGEYANREGPSSFMPAVYFVHDPGKDVKGYWADTVRQSGAEWITDDDTTTTTDDHYNGWMEATDEEWAAEKARRIEYYTMRGWTETDKSYLPHRGFNSYRVQGKLTYKINPWNAKFSLGSFANRDQFGAYVFQPGYRYKYNIDGLPYQVTKSFQINGTWRQQLGDKTFYTVIANYFDTKYQYGNIDTVYEKTRKFWQDYKILSDDDLNNNGIYDAYSGQQPDYELPDNPYGATSSQFISRGLFRSWERTEASYNALKFDLTSQINRNNQIQSGLEAKQHRCYRKYNSLPWDADPFKDQYLFYPRTAAWYLQDKLEFEGFIINAGLRLDYLSSRASYQKNQFSIDSGYVYPEPKWQISPRLGISHPVTELTVFHLSYGHFFQQPQFQYLFESLGADVVRRGNSIVGNPELEAQKNVAYEAGVAHQLAADLAIDLTVYYKDIFNLLGGTTIKDTAGTKTDYYGYTNSEYGNVRGFEVSVQKRPGNGVFSGRTSYSFQIAKGSASDPTEGYWNWRGSDPATGLQLQPPRVDNNLTFDQRHTFSVSTNFDFDKGFGPKIGNFRPLANVAINIQNNMGSGFPYSRTDRRGDVIGEYLGFRTPWTWTTDLLASKSFNINKYDFQLNFEMFNVFNRKNVQGVFPVTGKEDNDGSLQTLDQAFPGLDSIKRYYVDTLFAGPDSGLIYSVPNTYYSPLADLNQDNAIDRYEKYIAYRLAWEDICTDPINNSRDPSSRNYDAPRTMRLSLSLNF